MQLNWMPSHCLSWLLPQKPLTVPITCNGSEHTSIDISINTISNYITFLWILSHLVNILSSMLTSSSSSVVCFCLLINLLIRNFTKYTLYVLIEPKLHLLAITYYYETMNRQHRTHMMTKNLISARTMINRLEITHHNQFKIKLLLSVDDKILLVLLVHSKKLSQRLQTLYPRMRPFCSDTGTPDHETWISVELMAFAVTLVGAALGTKHHKHQWNK